MSLLSFFRKKSLPVPKKRPRRGKSDLEEQLELALSKKREAERMAAKLQREIDEVPKKLKQLEEDERRRIKDRAARTPTIQGLGRPYKLQVTDAGARLTRAQQRAMRNRLFLLFMTLAGILFLLWKSIR